MSSKQLQHQSPTKPAERNQETEPEPKNVAPRGFVSTSRHSWQKYPAHAVLDDAMQRTVGRTAVHGSTRTAGQRRLWSAQRRPTAAVKDAGGRWRGAASGMAAGSSSVAWVPLQSRTVAGDEVNLGGGEKR
ncbi:hypothetical protein GQ55_9G445000 [Panicum hallii var. hallii]|uniref:Uncharacterized protein n=1 Tax=Panicum hallii var. hallii TaxID=1504633 RepID=A0A2T7CBI0_9POAL|nr:hypothetical protein GQ55_9G445000 [Panicum hallii var. hallii]